MNREVWPEGYSSPSWLESLTEPIPWAKPTSQRPFWLGFMVALCLVFVVSLAVFSDEDGRGISGLYLKSWPIFTTLSVALLMSGLAWVYSSECRVDRYFDLWLKSKAKADASIREWSPEDVELLKKEAEWIWHHKQNEADRIQEAREESWFRFFWRNGSGRAAKPKVVVSQEASYLLALAEEVEKLFSQDSQRKREAESSWQVQLDAAKARNLLLERRPKGFLPMNER